MDTIQKSPIKKHERIKLFFENSKIQGSKQYWTLWKWSLSCLITALLFSSIVFVFRTDVVGFNASCSQFLTGALIALGVSLIPSLNEMQKQNIFWQFVKTASSLLLICFSILILLRNSELTLWIQLLVIVFLILSIGYLVRLLIAVGKALVKVFISLINKLTISNSNDSKFSTIIKNISALILTITTLLGAIASLLAVFNN